MTSVQVSSDSGTGTSLPWETGFRDPTRLIALEAKDLSSLAALDVMTIAAGAARILSDLLTLGLVRQIYRMQMSHVRA